MENSLANETEQRNLALADVIAANDLIDLEEFPFGDDTARRRILARERRDDSEQAWDNWLWWLSLDQVRWEE